MEVNSILGEKYRLIRKLGEGGMGVVYAALDTEVEEEVAIKVLTADSADSDDSVRRFYREAKAASAVDHPGVVEVFDFGHAEDGSPYLVMELLEGYTLEKVLKRASASFDIEAAVQLAIEVLQVLAVVHQEKVVHRDLKPENIFIHRKAGDRSLIKVLDFGASKFADREESETQLTSMGTIIGSVYYMAPEQALGREDVDHRADLWAVGVVLYRLLTGALPFYGKETVRVLEEILIDEPRPLRLLRPEVPEKLSRVVARAMAKDREDRYQDANEFIMDLVLSLERPTPLDTDSPLEVIELADEDLEPLTNREALQLLPKPAPPKRFEERLAKTTPMPLPLELLGEPVKTPLSEVDLRIGGDAPIYGVDEVPIDLAINDEVVETFVNIYPYCGNDDEDITAVTPLYQFVLGDDAQPPTALETFIASIKGEVEHAPEPKSVSTVTKTASGKAPAAEKTVDESPETSRFSPFVSRGKRAKEEAALSSRLKLGWKITVADSGMVIEPALDIMRKKTGAPDLEQTSGWFVKVVKRVKRAMTMNATAEPDGAAEAGEEELSRS